MAATLKLDTITNPSNAGTANLFLDASGNATVGNTLVMGSSFKRNRIINGDMRVAQRGTSFTASGYTLDRWATDVTTTGAFTVTQNSTAPVGFVNSIQFTKTTGNAPASGDANYIYQAIEGVNSADLGWGTANAKTITLSFWVYSGATGTFGGSLRNGAATYYSYPFTYTVTAINTWEYKTVTIAGPGAGVGTWATNTNAGIYVFFDLGSGTSVRTTANAWTSGNYVGVTGTSTYPTSTSGGTIYFTGVQLEVGSIATPYERQIYSNQLIECYRYYYRITAPNTNTFFANGECILTADCEYYLFYPVTMRAAPSSLEQTGTATNYTNRVSSGNVNCNAVPYLVDATIYQARIDFPTGSGLTGGQAAAARANAIGAYLGFSAEL